MLVAQWNKPPCMITHTACMRVTMKTKNGAPFIDWELLPHYNKEPSQIQLNPVISSQMTGAKSHQA